MMRRLRSGEVAAAVGVNLQTLRYYERRGLLAEPERTPGGHRVYSRDAVTMVRIIKATQRLGFTLDEVAGLLDAGRHWHGARPDAGLRRQVAAKLAEVDARIADLRAIRGTLAAALESGCDDLAACAESPACPLPFAELAWATPQTSSSRRTSPDDADRQQRGRAAVGDDPKGSSP
jgi:MerR family mercuric resistance operon transcriptional regulator